MANIVLSHAYFLKDDPKEQQIMRPYPPLGILYLSAWLDQHGFEHAVFDTTFSDRDRFYAFLLENKPAVLALYTNLMSKLNIVALLQFVRTHPDLQHTLVVLGGPDVTHNATDYLKVGADLIVIGEGEQTMLEIVQTVSKFNAPQKLPGSAFGHIDGLAFFTEENVLFKTPSREKLRELDDLPMPNRQKIDLDLYLNAWKKAHGQSAVSVSTQRGCPYTCRWCSTAVYGQSYRRRSPAAVADEIEWLQQHYTFDLIWFVDDVFTVSHKWLQQFREVLAARNIQIQFECITRADRLNEDVLQILKDCGCFRVWIGAESGSQRILDAMDRRVDVQQVREMIRAARKMGIQAGTFIMLGYPGETEADIRETVTHLKTANPDLFTITVAYPIKGTGLYDTVEHSLHPALPWAEHTDRDLDFPRTYPRRYYHYAVRWTVNSVLLHKGLREKQPLKLKNVKLLVKVLGARWGMRWWGVNVTTPRY